MRTLLKHECPLVAYLFEKAGLSLDLNTLLVHPMKDGGMGSLSIAPIGRSYGSSAAQCDFSDGDGAPVLAELTLDEAGEPFEIDIWKVDFSPMKRWPSWDDLNSGAPNHLV